MASKELLRKLKEFRELGMKDPTTRLQYKLLEIEPATLTEISRKMQMSREKTIRIVSKLLKANILSISCTKVDKLLVKPRKQPEKEAGKK